MLVLNNRPCGVQYHPDAVRHNPEVQQREANEKFRRILNAYKVLRNKERRAKYDATGQG